MDLLSKFEYDAEQVELRKAFRELRDKRPERLVHWAADEHRDSKEQHTILAICNQYELIAIGVQEGILDEALYRRWFRSQLLLDWEECNAFVSEQRHQWDNRKIFCEFEAIAEKWGSS